MKNCTYVLRSVLCIVMIALMGIVPGYSQFIEKGLRSANGEYLGFLEYKPADYNSKTTTKYPLIIFLHGIGERGNGTTELMNVARIGLPRIIKTGNPMTFTWNGKKETFLVLAPQCPKSYGMWPTVFIDELIQYAKNNLNIDPDRIFLTGLSMGGGGSLKYISTAPEMPKNFAAVATICAPCTFREPKYVADAKLPLWSFHAADDPTAPVNCTMSAIAKIRALNPPVNPLMDIWPTGGHLVWDRVYTDTNYRYQGIVNIYEWFLAQNRTFAVNKLPVANAGGTINITTGTGTATLNASASYDTDGKLVRYVWKKISGPVAGTITDPFGPHSSTTVTGLTVAGTYQYSLNVVDDRASFTADTVTVVVSNGASVENKLPVAKAGNDINITLPVASLKLDGSASSDPDGSIASYLWTKVSGPAVSISAPTSSVTNLNNLTEGTYIFKLKVTDNKGATAEDQITIVVKPVPNVAPVAKAGADITITLPLNHVTLNGSTSSDGDGTISNYLWTKVSGPAATIQSASSASTAVNSLVAGTYVFKLKVTDNDDATAEDQVTVIVKPAANVAPVSKAGNDITITLPLDHVTLNGSNSSDEDGTLTNYLWTKVSGPAADIQSPATASTAVNGLAEGTYVFKLKVTDNDGATAEDQVTVIVKPAPNVAPVAKAGNDITITLPENKTKLDGSGSSDADGSISEYEWKKISGPSQYIIANPSAEITDVTNLAEGTYKFSLTVTDNKGATDSDTIIVKVNAALPEPNVAPVAQAGTNKSITLPLDHVTLDGSSSYDEDGTIASYKWSFINGPETFAIAEPNSVSTEITGLVEGTYSFSLEVKDNDGSTNADTVNVAVKKADLPPPPPNKIPVAKAGDDITITLPVNEVTLDGSTSIDEDGTLTNYSWLKIGGPSQFKILSPSYHITKVQNLVEGVYSFRLQVKDTEGALGYDTIKVTVLRAPNEIPVSKAGIDQTIQLPVSSTTLNGQNSYDPDGTIEGMKWELVSGPSNAEISDVNSATPSVTGLEAGQYMFRLTVTDNEGAIASGVVTLIVLPEAPKTPPVAKAGADKQVQLPNPTIKLDGLDSYDPDGTIESYSWVKSDGPSGVTIANSSTATPTIIGVSEGTYEFLLTVTDNDGQTATDVVKVTVLAAPPSPNEKPVAIAGVDQTVSYPESTVNVDGSNSTDDDGTISSYEWTLVSGPTTPTIVSPHAATTEINNLETGEYLFELYVIDNEGAVSKDTVSISVVNTMRYEDEMVVYPNPARSNVNVQLTSDTMGLTKVSIYNAAGVVVKAYSTNKTQAQLFENVDISNLQTGMYYLEVIVGGKQRKITKFVKRM